MNKLYFGDCLDILKKLYHEHPDGFIDLIYIDPPFNSKRKFNILFEDADLKDTKAQKEAFADTWSNISYLDTIQELKNIDLNLSYFLETLDKNNTSKSAVAYLTTMAIRLWFMHKVLKSTGSFYLHCDPAMSHYLKVVCDMVFGGKNFRSEIIWRRTNSHNKLSKQYGPIHDTILFYSKTDKFIFHPGKRPYSRKYIADRFIHNDEHGRYQTNYLTGSGKRGGDSGSPWEGFDPTDVGRHWAIPDSLKQFLPESTDDWTTQDKLDCFLQQGLIIFPKKTGGQPMYKQYIGEGVSYQDIWAYQPNTDGVLHGTTECIDEDVKYLENEEEMLGYPTQKPIGLLKRIIETSANKNSLVADFFCGCGTTIEVSQQLNMQWIGVDISHLAVGLIQRRLIQRYGIGIATTFEIDGLPKDIDSAKELALIPKGGRLKFQDWIIETMLGGVHNPKKTADGGWDGHLTFETDLGKEIVLIEVKSGNVNVKNVREFIHVVNTQKAAIGIFVCFEEQITKPMLIEAKNAGYYAKEIFGNLFDKIQIISVESLINKEQIKIPNSRVQTFKTAKKTSRTDAIQKGLDF